jgi:hypothetical protein
MTFLEIWYTLFFITFIVWLLLLALPAVYLGKHNPIARWWTTVVFDKILAGFTAVFKLHDRHGLSKYSFGSAKFKAFVLLLLSMVVFSLLITMALYALSYYL